MQIAFQHTYQYAAAADSCHPAQPPAQPDESDHHVAIKSYLSQELIIPYSPTRQHPC
jgi:hypothetical protein